MWDSKLILFQGSHVNIYLYYLIFLYKYMVFGKANEFVWIYELPPSFASALDPTSFHVGSCSLPIILLFYFIFMKFLYYHLKRWHYICNNLKFIWNTIMFYISQTLYLYNSLKIIIWRKKIYLRTFVQTLNSISLYIGYHFTLDIIIC